MRKPLLVLWTQNIRRTAWSKWDVLHGVNFLWDCREATLGSMYRVWNDQQQKYSKFCRISKFQENRLGEVCLALRYVPNKNKLSVVVMECKNLKKMDVLGLSGSLFFLILPVIFLTISHRKLLSLWKSWAHISYGKLLFNTSSHPFKTLTLSILSVSAPLTMASIFLLKWAISLRTTALFSHYVLFVPINAPKQRVILCATSHFRALYF